MSVAFPYPLGRQTAEASVSRDDVGDRQPRAHICSLFVPTAFRAYRRSRPLPSYEERAMVEQEFVLDVTKIRKDARQHMDDGPVTSTYQGSKAR